ncbi:inner membrane protein YpjD [Vogesella sp. LIG4]|uniref:cytochrome C assembly family protein n=1 Tax=Vogesella sp. LIG4 TaxID=1192162 RepID=UPI001E602B03|nr:cytochrome c biogenesis protein CcsA [Vogesella sp. LIG4]
MILVILLLSGYLGLSWHFIGHWRGVSLWPRQPQREHFLLGVLLAVHAMVLTLPVAHSGALNMGLGSALSLLAWIMLLIFWTGSYFARMEGLQVFLVPLGAIGVLMAEVLPLPHTLYQVDNPAFILHLLVSLLAYSLFAIGALLAILMLLQEKALHEHRFALAKRMPPLLVLENLMFQTLGTGFVLLTFSLLSGVFFAEEVFGRAVPISHKVVFAVLSWLVFGGLLVGRKLHGWRGRIAIRWTLTGFALLLLGYIGSKVVLQFFLHKI